MKKIISTFVMVLACAVANAQFSVYTPTNPDYSRSTPIAPPPSTGPFTVYTPSETQVVGRTYNATVYYESSTGHENTYKLPVVVRNGSVDKICFRDGGSVHVGINNSGYKYYGGELEYVKEYDVFATEVKIVYSGGSWAKYTVIIQ